MLSKQLVFPWKIGGLAVRPVEKLLKPFYPYDRILTEEKFKEIVMNCQQAILTNQLQELYKIIEIRLAQQMHNHMDRIIEEHQNFKFEIRQVDNINLYNITNVYRVGVIKSRQKIRVNDIAKNTVEIDGKSFQTFFKKKPDANDMAVIGMWLDLSFDTDIKYESKDESFSGNEIHTLRLEYDILEAQYRSVKQNIGSDYKNFKIMQNYKPLIIDIDGYLNGNEFI